MSSNTVVHNHNIALLSIPTWTTVQSSLGSYPKGVWHIVGATLVFSVAANILREYVKGLGEQNKRDTGFKGMVANHKNSINAIIYPFAEHPFKIAGVLGAFYFWSHHK